jgi:hypothetical protein
LLNNRLDNIILKGFNLEDFELGFYKMDVNSIPNQIIKLRITFNFDDINNKKTIRFS